MATERPRKAPTPRKPMPKKPPKVEVPITVYRRRPKHPFGLLRLFRREKQVRKLERRLRVAGVEFNGARGQTKGFRVVAGTECARGFGKDLVGRFGCHGLELRRSARLEEHVRQDMVRVHIDVLSDGAVARPRRCRKIDDAKVVLRRLLPQAVAEQALDRTE